MKNLLIMQENEFSGTISMYPSTVQPFCTNVDKLATSNLQICFPAPYLSLHAKCSHMPNMPRGQTSPGLPYLFSPTRLINSIKHEHSCKILYVFLYFILFDYRLQESHFVW